jgi:hypothetical protein
MRSSPAKATGKFDYDAKIEVPAGADRYRRCRSLMQPDYLLIEQMTTVPMAAVAREVVEVSRPHSDG